MNRRIPALLLTCALALSPALGVDVSQRFPARNDYPGYSDVPAGIWFEANARLCYETGLMTGTDQGFQPHQVMTAAQAAAIAARMGHILAGGDGMLPNPPGGPWYAGSVDYLAGLASGDAVALSLLAQPEQPLTRFGFLRLLNLALPEDLLVSINAIDSLPDTADPAVLRFYRAGILTGVNAYGFFQGAKTLTRAEAAAMVSRVARPELRASFAPVFDPAVWASGVTPETVFFQTEAGPVTAQAYLAQVDRLTGALEQSAPGFHWHDIGEDGLTHLEAVKQSALSSLGVTAQQCTEAYRSFDLQVYYSRTLDLRDTSAL